MDPGLRRDDARRWTGHNTIVLHVWSDPLPRSLPSGGEGGDGVGACDPILQSEQMVRWGVWVQHILPSPLRGGTWWGWLRVR